MDREEDKRESVLIPVKWIMTEETQTRYANHLMVTHAGGEFYLVFGEIFLPAGMPEEKPEFAEIKSVARIAITPENMIKFAEVIQHNVDKYRERTAPDLKEVHNGND